MKAKRGIALDGILAVLNDEWPEIKKQRLNDALMELRREEEDEAILAWARQLTAGQVAAVPGLAHWAIHGEIDASDRELIDLVGQLAEALLARYRRRLLTYLSADEALSPDQIEHLREALDASAREHDAALLAECLQMGTSLEQANELLDEQIREQGRDAHPMEGCGD